MPLSPALDNVTTGLNSLETSVAIELSDMKLLNKIRERVGLSPKKDHHLHRADPVHFHQVHGENILLSSCGTIASRMEGFSKAIVFTNRLVKVNEKIYVKIHSCSESWSGSMRVGFSAVNPNQMRNLLPGTMCPELSSKNGFWGKALSERFTPGTVIYFYLNTKGDVVLGSKGLDKGVLLSGVNISRPLWAMLDIYGNTTAVQLLDPKLELNNLRSSPPVKQKNQDSSEANSHQAEKRSFLKTCYGRNISISFDRRMAAREGTEFCNGYMFLDQESLWEWPYEE